MLNSHEKIDKKELEQINEMVLKNSEDLTSTIENLVDIAHLSTNQFNVKKSKFELKQLLISISTQIKHNFIYNNISEIDFQFEIDGNIEIYSDQSIISKIIMHLLKNAILYTEKGFIKLGYQIKNSNIIIYVQDTGIGIPQEKIDIIFSTFQRGDENVNLKVGGTGLGLSIVNELIKLLNGKIWVESIVGKGSTFFVSLPLSADNQ